MHPRSRSFSLVTLVATVIVVAACSTAGGGSVRPGGAYGGGYSGGSAGKSPAPSTVGGKVPFVPRIISSESVVGPSRFVFGITDASGTKTIGGPDLKAQVMFTPAARDSSGSTPGGSPGTSPSPIAATFIWAIPNERGVYTVTTDFPTAGDWTFQVTAQGKGMDGASVDGTVPVSMQVAAKGYAIPIGARAPSTKTPTLADVGGDPKKLSTDTKPEPSFYRTSVEGALAEHEPFVLVFATPGFCRTAQCGPTLDGVKAVARETPGTTFINVEPYELAFTDGRLQPVLDANNQLKPTATTSAWGILSEPWIFVVDGNGIVKGSFEAVVGPDELKAAIAAAR